MHCASNWDHRRIHTQVFEANKWFCMSNFRSKWRLTSGRIQISSGIPEALGFVHFVFVHQQSGSSDP